MAVSVGIIFPHQLFEDNPLLKSVKEVYLIEEYLFFRQYKFHKQKIAFHRATMSSYKVFLEQKGLTVHYIDAQDDLSDIRNFGNEIKSLQ